MAVVIAIAFSLWRLVRKFYLGLHVEVINENLEELGYKVEESMLHSLDFESYRIDYARGISIFTKKHSTQDAKSAIFYLLNLDSPRNSLRVLPRKR